MPLGAREGSGTNVAEMESELHLKISHYESVLRRRYELISIGNDIAIALWFIVGSILFFNEATTYLGTWFFLLGSLELLARPVIRLVRRTHLGRIGGQGAESARDF